MDAAVAEAMHILPVPLLADKPSPVAHSDTHVLLPTLMNSAYAHAPDAVAAFEESHRIAAIIRRCRCRAVAIGVDALIIRAHGNARARRGADETSGCVASTPRAFDCRDTLIRNVLHKAAAFTIAHLWRADARAVFIYALRARASNTVKAIKAPHGGYARSLASLPAVRHRVCVVLGRDAHSKSNKPTP